MDAAGGDFGGGSGVFIDEHNEFALFEETCFGGEVFFAGFAEVVGIDDHALAGDELVADFEGHVEVAAAVATQVEDEVFHALFLQAADGFFEFGGGGGGEAFEFDVAGERVGHEADVDAVHRDGAAGDDELDGFFFAAAHHGDFHLGTFFAAQVLAYPVVGDALSDRHGVIDLDDLVTGHQSDFFRRTVDDDLHHVDGVLDELEGHADAVEGALQGFGHGGNVLGGDVGGVRVQLFEHLVDGSVGQRVEVNGIHVHGVDGVE